jgi:DNA-binding transcriptional MocR family regulator
MTSTDSGRKSVGSRTRTVAGHLAAQIKEGRLATGAKLPSVRELGRLHACSLTTVLQALELLEREDLIVGVPRSGHYVKSPRGPASLARRGTTSLEVVRGRTHGMLRRILEMSQTSAIAPFHAAVPSPELLPLGALRRTVTGHLVREESLLGRYSPVAGAQSARTALARFLAPRGLKVNSQALVLTNGCSEALSLAIEVTSRPGEVIAIESPTFFGLVSLLEQLGRNVVEILVARTAGSGSTSWRKPWNVMRSSPWS